MQQCEGVALCHAAGLAACKGAWGLVGPEARRLRLSMSLQGLANIGKIYSIMTHTAAVADGYPW